MTHKGSLSYCKKCNLPVKTILHSDKGEHLNLGEYYLNYFKPNIKISLYCEKCGSLLRKKYVGWYVKIDHCCKNKKMVYNKELELVDNREGFKFNYLKSKLKKKKISLRLKDNTTRNQEVIELRAKASLTCLDCGEEIIFERVWDLRLYSFVKCKQKL